MISSVRILYLLIVNSATISSHFGSCKSYATINGGYRLKYFTPQNQFLEDTSL